MPDSAELARQCLLTLPESPCSAVSIRAQALLFHDPRSAGLLEQVERIARSEATVLVVGETGTGKELIARHLHTCSRRKGPFMAVNCGTLNEALIDAELFGHESGAYTGAAQARAGWFEAAHGGTLFLDEIGDLPLALQVKLLRALQERQVVRLGSRKPIALDVRLVAATNIDLRQAVDAQRFRADLYYRLSVATVQLPPLRERSGDILPLARHFIHQYGHRLGTPEVVLSPAAEAALLRYLWPGNIRELENVIHFALIICRQGVIDAPDLKLVAAAAATGPVAAPSAAARPEVEAAPAVEPAVTPWLSLEGALEALLRDAAPRLLLGVEEALVRAAYAQVGENQVRAARILGVTRNTLRTLLKRHGMLAEPPALHPAAGSAGAPLAH
jgi:sigma-54-specific transcriptional regulator